MQTLLVTGGAGFIGGCFVRQSIAAGDTQVVNLDKLTYAGNLESLGDALNSPRHTFVHGDIADRTLVDGAACTTIAPRPSSISRPNRTSIARSMARAISSAPTCWARFELLEAVRGYWGRLDDAARQTFRFLHISTDEVFGSLGTDGCVSRNHALRPQFALFGHQGGGRPPGAGLLSHLPPARPVRSTARTTTARASSPKS